LRQRKFDLAAEEFERILKSAASRPEIQDARFGLANARLFQGRYSEAMRAFDDFRKDAQGDSRSLTAQFRLGELSHLLGDLTRARRELEVFTATANGHAGLEMAWTYLGDTYLATGQPAPARTAYERSLSTFPKGRLADQARFGLGRALAALGEREQATAVFRPLAADRSQTFAPRAALELATLELERDRTDAALATLDAALKQFPESPQAPALLFRSAEALQKQKRIALAQARFLKLAESNPKDPWADDALYRACLLALEKEDAATVERLAATFAARYPKSQLLHEVRLLDARARSLQGNPKEAIEILEGLLAPPHAQTQVRTTSLTPAFVQAVRYELALAYRATGRSAEADAALSRLAGEDPSPYTADAQFLLGQTLLEVGRHVEAIGLLEKYLAAEPQGKVAEFALAHLAVAKIGAGRLADAWKDLGALADRFPQSKLLPATRLRLAEAALQAKESARAAEQFRLIVDFGLQGSIADRPLNGDGRRRQPIDAAVRIRALAGLGRALNELNKPDEAATVFAKIVALAPGDPVAPRIALERGRALESGREPESALGAYSELAKQFGDTDYALLATLARGRLLARLGRHGEAAAEFKRLLADPKAQKAFRATGTTEDEVLAEWGWALVDAHEPGEADSVFARLLKDYPQSPHSADARFNLAESANSARDYKKVVDLLTPLAVPKPPIQSVSPADFGPERDQSDRAAAGRSGQAESIERLRPLVLYRLGRTQFVLRNWVNALQTFDRLQTEYPDSVYRREAGFLRAEAALQQGKFDVALAGFSTLLNEPTGKSDPDGFALSLRLKQIECWVALRRWKEVLSGTETLTHDLAPGHPAIAEAEYSKGQALLGSGQVEAARKTFQSLISGRKSKADDLAARAQLMCGETYFHEDHFHEALREFFKVDILYQAPRWQAAALMEAGKVYERLDQWADAAETYKQLLSRFPDDATAALARNRLEAAIRKSAASHSESKS
jgi:TolA-binding protein